MHRLTRRQVWVRGNTTACILWVDIHQVVERREP
jgi:hypothetical protein